MRRAFLIAALSALLAAAVLLPAGGSAAPPDKGPLCHLKGDGSYLLMNVPVNVVANHIADAHGDGKPGGLVPGIMNGVMFGADCVPIFAVAYTDINPANRSYDPDVDVLISKLVDANNNGVPDAGDEVIAHQYPKDFDFGTFGHGNFGVTTHTVAGFTTISTTTCIASLGPGLSTTFEWFSSFPTLEAYVEEGSAGATTGFFDEFFGPESLITDPASPSAPPDALDLSSNTSADHACLDVQLNCLGF